MYLRVIVFGLASAALTCCGRTPSPPHQHAPEIIETAWTNAAANHAVALMNTSKLHYALPELRIYDASQRLIFRQVGDKPAIVAATLEKTIVSDRPIAGPSLAETLTDLETSDHRPASQKVPSNGEVTVVDYWASWCVPCKAVGKKLTAWAATKPTGTVRIVKAETDLMKAAAGQGIKIERYHQVKGPDGKLHLVHVA